MTRTEANRLLIVNRGDVCTRLFRRADGTIMTADCPLGLRSISRRVSKIAGAALSAALNLYGTAIAQTPAQTATPEQSAGQQQPRHGDRVLSGVVKDSTGAVVPNASVTLANQSGQQLTLASDPSGAFVFSGLPIGVYTVTVQMAGFQKFERRNLVLALEKKTQLELTLALGTMGEVVYIEPVKHRTTSPLRWLKKK